MRVIGCVLAGLLLLGAPMLRAEDAPRKKKGTLQAQRAGWMLGMFVGEEPGHPYPFVLEVDPKSEAKLKGVRSGDELIRFEDEEVRQLAPLYERVMKLPAGREVTLWMRRGSHTIQFRLRVPKNHGPAPQEAAAEKQPEKAADAGESGSKEKKKKKKRPPVVIKPIPGENP